MEFLHEEEGRVVGVVAGEEERRARRRQEALWGLTIGGLRRTRPVVGDAAGARVEMERAVLLLRGEVARAERRRAGAVKAECADAPDDGVLATLRALERFERMLSLTVPVVRRVGVGASDVERRLHRLAPFAVFPVAMLYAEVPDRSAVDGAVVRLCAEDELRVFWLPSGSGGLHAVARAARARAALVSRCRDLAAAGAALWAGRASAGTKRGRDDDAARSNAETRSALAGLGVLLDARRSASPFVTVAELQSVADWLSAAEGAVAADEALAHVRDEGLQAVWAGARESLRPQLSGEGAQALGAEAVERALLREGWIARRSETGAPAEGFFLTVPDSALLLHTFQTARRQVLQRLWRRTRHQILRNELERAFAHAWPVDVRLVVALLVGLGDLVPVAAATGPALRLSPVARLVFLRARRD
jgi:hypothetical protein